MLGSGWRKPLVLPPRGAPRPLGATGLEGGPGKCAPSVSMTQGGFSRPLFIGLSRGSRSPGGVLAPVPPCVSAGFYVALEGSAASRGQGAGGGGSGRTLPVPEGGKWNPRRRGPTRSISQDAAMLVPRTARPEAPRTPASSVDEDKVDSPAAQVQMRQEGCSRLQKRRESLGIGATRMRTAPPFPRQTVEPEATKCPQGFPLTAERALHTRAHSQQPRREEVGRPRTRGQRETEAPHPGPRASAATPATRVGLAATVSGGVAPSPSVRLKQTKLAVLFGGVKCVQRRPRNGCD